MENVNEVLDFAINNEQGAHDFYMEMAGKVKAAELKKTFEQFAKEEAGHKAKLESVKAGKKLLSSGNTSIDLKLSEYLVDVEATPDLDYQDALILAMKREKAAFRLYTDLAGRVDDPAIKELFLGLAQEEAKHKLRFEVEYDENILSEN